MANKNKGGVLYRNKKLLPTKPCQCGCDELIPDRDAFWRPLKFKNGHGSRGKKGKSLKGALNPSWNGGIVTNRFGYIQRYFPNHPRSIKRPYVLEHILVVEGFLTQMLGFKTYIARNLVIHHKNENQQDNRLENLEIMTCRQHSEYHISRKNLRIKGIFAKSMNRKKRTEYRRVRHLNEHRLIMQKHLGRFLTKNEEVHHINEDKRDNRIENLELMTKSEHMRFHQSRRFLGFFDLSSRHIKFWNVCISWLGI